MIESISAIAERCVNRLLDEEYGSADDYSRRPGGKHDPMRQTTVNPHLDDEDFTAKRPGAPVGEDEDADAGEEVPIKHKNRFNLKFNQESKAKGLIGKAPGNITRKKAGGGGGGTKTSGSGMKKGKASGGKLIGGKPGKISHRESVERMCECKCKGGGHAPWCKEKGKGNEDKPYKAGAKGSEEKTESRALGLLQAITGR